MNPNTKTHTARSSPVSLDEIERSTGHTSTAVTLPPECYFDEEFYRFEEDAIFSKEWICLGRAEQVPEAGDFFTAKVLGEPLIVARKNDGSIHVMSSVCRHRAMCITDPDTRPFYERLDPAPESSGKTQSFRCPYHWWTYDLEGKLIGAPEMSRTEDFDPESIRLPAPKLELWRGFIFINFDDSAEPLGPQVKQLDDIIGDYPMEQMVTVNDMAGAKDVPFNWKIMIENAMDAYHVDRLHEGIHDFAPAVNTRTLDLDEGSSVIINHVDTPDIDSGANATFKAFFPHHPMLSEDERSRALYICIAPTLFLSIYADIVGWLTIYPTGPTSHDQAWNILVHPPALQMENFDALLDLRKAAIEGFNSQDLPVDVSVQAGIKSRYAIRGKLSWQEGFVPQFNRWLLDRFRKFEDPSQTRKESNDA